MAITYDNALQTQVDSSVTSVTRSFSVTGTDTAVVSNALTNIAADMSGVTYNSVSLTKAGEMNRDAFSTEVHYLLDTATGSNNLVWSSGSSATFVTTATSYAGVKTSFTPNTSQANSTSSTMSDSITIGTANSWIISSSRTGGAYPNATGTNYERRAYNTTNGVHIGDSNGGLSTGSQTVSVGLSSSTSWHIFLLELEEAPTASTFTPKIMWFS